MSRLGKLAVAGLVAVLCFALGLGPLFGSLLYTLTPLQRQYLLPYVLSSWRRNEPADRTEIRWIVKLAAPKTEPKPDPKGKRDHGSKTQAPPESKTELAEERDLVAKPLTDRLWAGDALPFTLSEEAVREGWTGLTWGYPHEIPSSQLAPLLREDYFGDRPWPRYFVQPVVAIASLCLLVLIGRVGVQAWQDRRLWGRPVQRPDSPWRWMLATPAPEVIQAPEKPAPLTLAAPLSRPLTAMTMPPAQATVPKQPAVVQTVAPVVAKEPKPAFVWDETTEID